MLDDIKKRFSFVLQVCMATMIGVLLALNMVQFITRYLINFTITWLNDFNIFLLIWITCVALPWLWLERKHLVMDFADKFIPAGLMRMLQHLYAYLAMIIAAGLMASGFKAAATNTGLVATTMGWDESIRYYSFVLCGALWIACAVIDELIRIRDEKKGEVK